MNYVLIADIAQRVFTACIDALAIAVFVGTLLAMAAILTGSA